jgi:hypothetical protein
MIQKQCNDRRSGRAHNDQEQKRCAGPEFNKEHAHWIFDLKGISHCEFLPPNTTVKSDFYCDALRRLRENMQRKDRKYGATITGSITTSPPTRP